jgi:Na+-transporting NADH:ubiquinone oxidoreductase subunit F
MTTIAITVLAMSGISGFLALMLSLANKTIANYGEQEVYINDDKKIVVDGGDTLLSALVDQKIFIPSACGGKGSCGYCKVTVIEGGGQILPTELGYVTKDERLEGVRLACQLKVKESLRIQIPEELFSVRQMTCEVAFLKSVTPTIKHLRVTLPANADFTFKPGQYVQILAPKYKGNEEEVYRAYSIASSPDDHEGLELFIGLVEGGVATTFVHEHLQVGQPLIVVGPYGEFYYHENERPMILVAIGTGMSPIMSILKYMKDHKINRQATFFFGARTREDLFEMDTLMALESEMPNLEVITCLSRPTEQCHWDGDVGRVTDLIKKYLKDAENSEAYLCGSPKMIDSVIPLLAEKGLPENLIFYDKFES